MSRPLPQTDYPASPPDGWPSQSDFREDRCDFGNGVESQRREPLGAGLGQAAASVGFCFAGADGPGFESSEASTSPAGDSPKYSHMLGRGETTETCGVTSPLLCDLGARSANAL